MILDADSIEALLVYGGIGALALTLQFIVMIFGVKLAISDRKSLVDAMNRAADTNIKIAETMTSLRNSIENSNRLDERGAEDLRRNTLEIGKLTQAHDNTQAVVTKAVAVFTERTEEMRDMLHSRDERINENCQKIIAGVDDVTKVVRSLQQGHQDTSEQHTATLSAVQKLLEEVKLLVSQIQAKPI